MESSVPLLPGIATRSDSRNGTAHRVVRGRIVRRLSRAISCPVDASVSGSIYVGFESLETGVAGAGASIGARVWPGLAWDYSSRAQVGCLAGLLCPARPTSSIPSSAEAPSPSLSLSLFAAGACPLTPPCILHLAPCTWHLAPFHSSSLPAFHPRPSLPPHPARRRSLSRASSPARCCTDRTHLCTSLRACVGELLSPRRLTPSSPTINRPALRRCAAPTSALLCCAR